MPDAKPRDAASAPDRSEVGADAYDHLPYVSMPIVHTQPTRLAALAQIFGLPAPAADTGRVLEIGCASGGNIIPLAARFPGMRFLGLDLSLRHVRDGQARIAQLGVSNIEIRQADVTTVDLGEERFDFILCHGVYSWVPPEAQDAILRLGGRHLGDDGIASISYNVLPGWHLRNVVRDICLQHAGEGRPHERVARARTILQQLGAATSTASPYGHVIASEARRLATTASSYLLGEFLTAHNAPCHFKAFAARAAVHGLSYVCEGDVPSSSIVMQAPRAADSIRAMAGEDPIQAQQLLDNFTGRTFRRSVLVRLGSGSKSAIGPATARLDGLHFAGAFTRQDGGGKGGVAAFKDHRGRIVKTRSAAGARMLAMLGERYPATASLAELLAGRAGDGARVRADLLKLIVNGRVTIASLPLRIGRASDKCPEAWPLARAEAATRQPWVSSLRHMPVLINPQMRLLLRQMDGSNDRRALAALLARSFDTGGATGRFEATTEDDAAKTVERAIAYLAHNAVLMPQ